VTPTGKLTLDRVTVRNGRCNGSCTTVGGIEPNGGGGIYNSGTLTITNSILSGSSGTLGGGIFNNGGTVIVTNSTISGNNSFQVTNDEDGGGGIRNSGTLTVTASTISGNSAKAGGGIDNSGTLTVTSSTISGNTAAKYGGGIYNFGGNATVANTTLSGNSAGSNGGGIFKFDTFMTITSNTIAGNTAIGGGGIYKGGGGSETVENNILANNGGENCYAGLINNDGNNLDSGNSCGFGSNNGSMSNTDPMLGPLANNGGPTQTMALLPGSPAIDAGNTSFCSSSPVNGVDQRGMSRPQGGGCDIGAYEYNGTFWDVPLNYWAWNFIERLYSVGISGGCGVSPLMYCPDGSVTRAQMAIFLLRGIHGASYTPPAVGGSTGFGDVPTSYWAAAWIKQLVAEGITSGCGAGTYCPESPVTRAQMAVFLVRTFNLP
jgi:S-layer homology domain